MAGSVLHSRLCSRYGRVCATNLNSFTDSNKNYKCMQNGVFSPKTNAAVNSVDSILLPIVGWSDILTNGLESISNCAIVGCLVGA
jgi:hypothetical protein